MKTLLFLLFSLAINLNLFADPVDPEKASKIAANFYSQMNADKGLSDLSLSLVFTSTSTDISVAKGSERQESAVFYIFNINRNDGYVVVAADDEVSPVLGYSLTGNYSGLNLPPACKKLLEKYKSEIVYVVVNGLQADNEIQQKWNRLERGESLCAEKDLKTVNPLLTTTWDQTTYYNAQCPGGSLTGCVATAMAQIMKFWNYPASGSGFHSYNENDYGTLSANFAATTYNWGSMPNHLTGSNSAVATLMFQCGVSVDMDYSPAGSYAYVISAASPITNCAEYAYKTYFGYNSSTMQGLLRAYYSDAAWKNLLKTDLNAGRPIQYAGSGLAGGHTFVCDGFDNNDFFHMNWGWGGSYDGYWNLDALNPDSYIFNTNQQAIIGIQPASGGVSAVINLYSTITISPNPIDFAQAFTVNADLINNGTSSFSGDYCAAVFNTAGDLIDIVETLSASGSPLPPGYHYTSGLTFSSSGLLAVPGSYIIGIFFRDPGGNWNLAGDVSYANPVSVSINSPYDFIQLYSAITPSPATFVQSQSASVNVNLLNAGATTFYGSYAAALYDLNGNFVQTIGTYNETGGLPSGYAYLSPYLTFSTAAITADPGTYILAIVRCQSGSSDWYLAGGQYYTNPVNIDVVGAPLYADTYESNNTVATSTNLTLSYSGNSAHKVTTGSNIHVPADEDFYKIILGTGYNYTISARVHDSYNSGNGQTYTDDVMFSYRINSGAWSDVYDDVMPGTINVTGAGTVYFDVASYFQGQTGTYLLDITVNRTSTSGVEPVSSAEQNILIIPNPATDVFEIRYDPGFEPNSYYQIFNVAGKIVQQNGLSATVSAIDIQSLSKGIYYVKIMNGDEVCVKKLSKL